MKGQTSWGTRKQLFFPLKIVDHNSSSTILEENASFEFPAPSFDSSFSGDPTNEIGKGNNLDANSSKLSSGQKNMENSSSPISENNVPFESFHTPSASPTFSGGPTNETEKEANLELYADIFKSQSGQKNIKDHNS